MIDPHRTRIPLRKPIKEIADLHDLIDTLTELAWALSERDRKIQFTLADGTHFRGRVILVDSGPLESGASPPYFAEMTVELPDGTVQTFNLLDISTLGPYSAE